jgi:hypothetical protein
MRLGELTYPLDHRKLFFLSSLPNTPQGRSPGGQAWSIPQPRLANISSSQKVACKDAVNKALLPILTQIRQCRSISLTDADELSKTVAGILVDSTGAIVGRKLPTHEKRRYQSLDLTRAQAEITTISKARDLVRTLTQKEYRSSEERQRVENHLSVLLDRLIRMGLNSVPPLSSDLKALNEWSQMTAHLEILNIKEYIRMRRCDMDSMEKDRQRKLFLNPRTRGKWHEHVLGSQRIARPNFAVDSKSEKGSTTKRKSNAFTLKKELASSETSSISLPLSTRSWNNRT